MTASAQDIETMGLAPPDAAEPAPRPAPRSLRWGASWTLAGNMAFVGSQWVMLVILAKLTPAEAVGKFVLAMAVAAPVFYFANLALRYVLVTDARAEFAFGEYLGLRFLTTAGGVLVILVIAFAAPHPRETAIVITIVGLAKAFEAVGDIFQGRFQREDRMDLAAKSMILKGVLSLVALTLALVLTGSLFYGTLGLAAGWGAGLALYDLPMARLLPRSRREGEAPAEPPLRDGEAPAEPSAIRRRGSALASPSQTGIRPHGTLARLARLAWVALPLGITGALLSLNTSIPRYFIDRVCGERELGIFGAIASLIMAGGTVIGSVCTAASPRLAALYASGQAAQFRRLVLRLVALGAVLGLGGLAVALLGGGPLLALLFRPEYGEHVSLFVGVMVVGLITYPTWILGTAMVSARYFRVQPFLATATLLAMVVLSAVLIPTRGLPGAVVAMGVATLLQGGASLACVAHALRALRPESLQPGGKQ